VDIDVLGDEGTSADDEILVKNPAFDCVVDIRTVIPAQSEEENLDEDSAMDRILKTCEAEQGVISIHLKTMVASIMNQRLIDLNTLSVVGGCSMFYSQTLKNATRLRDRLCLFSKQRIEGIEDAHAFLLRQLPDEFLASYLNLLRFLKVAVSPRWST
jgi:hypothetical protein